MSQDTLAHEETLAKAAVVFCQKAYATFPEVQLEPLDLHYSDEDLTLAVTLPTGAGVRQAADALVRIALEVEDQYGVTIIARPENG